MHTSFLSILRHSILFDSQICREQFVALHEGLAFRQYDEAGGSALTLSNNAMPPLKLLAEQFRRSYHLKEQEEYVLPRLSATLCVLEDMFVVVDVHCNCYY